MKFVTLFVVFVINAEINEMNALIEFDKSLTLMIYINKNKGN